MKKVFYTANGPGDIIGSYRQWRQGRDDREEVSITYSGQLYDVCAALGVKLHAVSPHARKERLRDGDFLIEHRPGPSAPLRGLSFFLAEGWHTLGLIFTCICLNEDVAIVEDCPVWPLWTIACCFGVRIVAVLHCALWPSGFRPADRKARALQRVTGWFWEHCVDASLVVSPECSRQIRAIAPRLRTPLLVGLSRFRPEYFAAIPPPSRELRPFRILFAGRIERNKGVLDIVRIAALLERDEPGRYAWEICGCGSDADELRAFVESRGLSGSIFLRGKLDREQMAEAYGRSHAVIAPTTSRFAEGLVKTAPEAALAGRPLVTSCLCHALDLLADAIVEVPPEDLDAYAAAIHRLADDADLYETKRCACAGVCMPFVDEGQSWGGKLTIILREMLG